MPTDLGPCGSVLQNAEMPSDEKVTWLSQWPCVTLSVIWLGVLFLTFEFRVSSVTRGYPFKILKPHSYCTARATFFAERIVNIWNSLPHDSIDFSSLHAFKRGIEENDFSMLLCLY